MNCEELRQDYASYALGVAADPARGEIGEHLARQCPVCVAGVASAMATVNAMAGADPLAVQPKNPGRRAIPSAGREPKRARVGSFAPWAIAAALSIALLAIGIFGRRQIADTAKLARALPILDDPATRDVAFGQTDKPSKGRVFVNPGKGVVFIGANLPRLDAGKTFELWVNPAKGNPMPEGMFESQPDATAVFVRRGPVGNAAEIAVTVEPEGGSPQPTTAPFIVAKL